MDAVELSLFQSRLEAVCDEMGVVLRRSAFSPNIKDRLDYSCALFDADGALFGQAAHIPVHLGSMAYAMADVVAAFRWRPGDLVLLNDPFLGGTHLPDVTAVSPVFGNARLAGFVADRAHHANIGAARPGSMPVSRTLEEEGVVIAPCLALRGGELTSEGRALFDRLAGRSHATDAGYRDDARLGDFFAQIGAVRLGVERLGALVGTLGLDTFAAGVAAVNDYAERLARHALGALPPGRYAFEDFMDDDGAGTEDVAIRAAVTIDAGGVTVDLSGTDPQVAGNINCPRSVTAAAAYYVFRCLMAPGTPAAAGAFRPIRLITRAGTLLDAKRPAAVAAGNVETSMRIVDVLLGALAEALPERIPAASQGTMNNVAMGGRGARDWDYYETIGGGVGAHAGGDGPSGLHTHMTNTLNTPVEALESHYPVRVTRYQLRRGSGGAGAHRGGDGLVRELTFLERAEVTLLTERRRRGPWGLAGGAPGAPGENRLNGELLPAKIAFEVEPGDRVLIATPGGGGFRAP